MKRMAVVWILAGCIALVVFAVLYLSPRTDGLTDTPPEDFRTRLSSTGSMYIGWEDKHVIIEEEGKQALIALLNDLTIEPKLGGPKPTLAPGFLFSITSKAEDGTEEASFGIQGGQEIREYKGEKIIDYKLPEQDYQTLCGALYELFEADY